MYKFPTNRLYEHAFRVLKYSILIATMACLFPRDAIAEKKAKTDFREFDPQIVSPENFIVDNGVEVTVWATSPMLYNPANMDIDHNGRIWVSEGFKYRRAKRRSEGST